MSVPGASSKRPYRPLRLDATGTAHVVVGAPLRRAYCICRAFSESVMAEVAGCAGCGRRRSVRDHYSRRLAACMGVMADAETPARHPPEEL
jgi:hypothetical protein